MGLTAGISSNIGEARSHGIDASVDYQQLYLQHFWLTSRVNFTYATNEVIKNGEPDYQYEYLSRIGQPINQAWGLVAQRLFIDEAEVLNSPPQFNQHQKRSELAYIAGDIKYVDVNNDGKMDGLDMVPIGYPAIPEIVYGFGISSGIHGLDFSFFFQGVGRESFFIDPSTIAPFIDERNALRYIADNHWSEDNPDINAFWPRLSTTSIPNNEKSLHMVVAKWKLYQAEKRGDWLHFPRRYKGINIEKIRIYANGSKSAYFQQFKLWDPEMAGNGLGYPPQKVFNSGLNVNF